MLAFKKAPQDVPRRVSTDNRRASLAFSGVTAVEDGAYSLRAKIVTMKEDLRKSQESFISRERAYKTRISELEDEFALIKNRKTGWMRTSEQLCSLREMHHQINQDVDLVQGRRGQIVATQESAMVTTFRNRLFEIQTELEKEKGKTDDGSIGWIEKSHSLEDQVEALKEASDLLERLNQHLLMQNARLRQLGQAREEEHVELTASLSMERSRHVALQEECAAAKQERDALQDKVSY